MSLDDYQWVQRATPGGEKPRPRQLPYLRKGCGRHNWDRFSPQELKNKADSSKIKRQRKGVIQEMLRLQEGKEDVHLEKSLLTMYHDSHIQSQRTNQSTASRLSSDITKGNQGLKWVVAASDADGKMGSTKDHNQPQVTDSTFKKAVKWVITEESPPKPPKRPPVSLSVASVSSGVSVPPPSAPPVAEVDRIKAALKAKQEHIQKVIVDQEKRLQKQHVEQEEKKKKLQKQLEERKREEKLQQEKQFNDEVSAWGHELEVLCDMGFSNMQQLIPLLKTHVPTPASSLEPGAPLCEDGLQQVVMSLLAARN
jgi:hypothetical protein